MGNSSLMQETPRAIVAMSPSLDRTIEIVVCVPCFRRPEHLRRTLRSLTDQRTDRRFAVVMVENDASVCGSVPVASEFLRANRFAGLCVVEPRQGNCHAINAAFETSQAIFPAASYLLMIDDDEIASPDWLEQMVRAAEVTGADVVGGPVLQCFDESQRELQRHPAFRPTYDTTGPVPVIYGCGNCLIRRTVFEKLGTPIFDLRFNFLGGGDVDFFTRCRRNGMKFHWTAEAVISEAVPENRTRPSWIALRGLRIGAINYHVQRKVAQTSWLLRARLAAKVLALLPLSLFRAIYLFGTERRVLIALHPMIVAVGGLLAAFGIEPQPYKASKIIS